MRQTRFGLALLLIALVAACDTGGPEPVSETPFAPGVSSRASAESVDGLIVGHRLMEAGEYELALKAYARAANEQGITADVLSAFGSANLRLGRLGQAERNLRQAIEIDETFVPAWNNLGVVLMEKGQYGEAALMFKRAFALDSGESADIRDNLSAAMARTVNPAYTQQDTAGLSLVRRGTGAYVLLNAP